MAADRHSRRDDRGVALLIALLVTTLLMALVVEFTYGTRVSLRAAVNFRDSQRAYYLARSGVSFAGKILAENLRNGKLQLNLEQRDWQVVPIVSGGDVELRVRWEDEAGKINIANVRAGQPSLKRLEKLFGLLGIDLALLEAVSGRQDIRLVDELHRVMGDEEFFKIRDRLTVHGSGQVNINTASSPVLQSLGISAPSAAMIIEARGQNAFVDKSRLASTYGLDTVTLGMLDLTSNVFLVQSHATVGGYTRQAEAVIRRDAAGYTVLYWRIS